MDHDLNPELPGPDGLAALELFHQLAALSPADAATAAKITVRDADGRYIGDALLSAKAVAALNDATTSLNAYIADGGEGLAPAPEAVTVPLMEDVPELTDEEAADFHTGIEGFLRQDGSE